MNTIAYWTFFACLVMPNIWAARLVWGMRRCADGHHVWRHVDEWGHRFKREGGNAPLRWVCNRSYACQRCHRTGVEIATDARVRRAKPYKAPEALR